MKLRMKIRVRMPIEMDCTGVICSLSILQRLREGLFREYEKMKIQQREAIEQQKEDHSKWKEEKKLENRRKREV